MTTPRYEPEKQPGSLYAAVAMLSLTSCTSPSSQSSGLLFPKGMSLADPSLWTGPRRDARLLSLKQDLLHAALGFIVDASRRP
jgi:hypothetical protein